MSWRWLDDHSLTICAVLIAIELWIIGFHQENEALSGFIVDLGHNCASGAFLFILAMRTREKVKPEDKPD